MEGYEKKKKKELTDEKLVESVVEHAQEIDTARSKNHSAIVVRGLHDLAVRYSKCCSPVPGDEIVGFVTAEEVCLFTGPTVSTLST